MVQRSVLLLALLFVYSHATDIEQAMLERQRAKDTTSESLLGKTMMRKAAGMKDPPKGSTQQTTKQWIDAHQGQKVDAAVQQLHHDQIITTATTLGELLQMVQPSDLNHDSDQDNNNNNEAHGPTDDVPTKKKTMLLKRL